MKNFSISPDLIQPQAIEVCRTLHLAGHQSYLVGGCVRDLLLGTQPKDWDICTDASPEQVMKIFKKTIPTGLQHGTVTVVLEESFEVTTFRVEGEYTDGRRPEEVIFVANVEQDLARRDLTINAIAYDPILNKVIDPFNGINDLKNYIIRAVGIPTERFQEDGLRIMRVCRFVARFGYDVHNDTFEGMKSAIDTLKKVSKERISDELCKILMADYPKEGLRLLGQSGALEIACPLLCSDGLLRAGQDRATGELETRLAFMYSNYPHSVAEQELTNLKFSNKEIKKVVFLLQLYELFDLFQKKESESSYKSFMAHVKNHSPEAWEHTLEQFILLTESMGYQSKVLFEKYQPVTVLSRKEMVLNGNDLLATGMPAGPRIKKALDACYLEILQNPESNTKSYLLTLIIPY